jgi:hypothetical protein
VFSFPSVTTQPGLYIPFLVPKSVMELWMLSIVLHICDSKSQEVEAEGLQI